MIFLVVTVLDGSARASNPDEPTTALPMIAFLAFVMVVVTAVRAYGMRTATGESSERTATPPVAPPGWAADPFGRHEHRYWDGNRWTEHIADRGVIGTNPPVW